MMRPPNRDSPLNEGEKAQLRADFDRKFGELDRFPSRDEAMKEARRFIMDRMSRFIYVDSLGMERGELRCRIGVRPGFVETLEALLLERFGDDV